MGEWEKLNMQSAILWQSTIQTNFHSIHSKYSFCIFSAFCKNNFFGVKEFNARNIATFLRTVKLKVII